MNFFILLCIETFLFCYFSISNYISTYNNFYNYISIFNSISISIPLPDLIFSFFTFESIFSHILIIRKAGKENRYRQLSRIKSIIY